MRPLHIAVLECDSLMPLTRARHGNYTALYARLLRRGAASLALPVDLRFSTWDAQRGEFPALKPAVEEGEGEGEGEEVDAVLVSGSKHSAFSPEPWITELVDWLKGVLAQGRVKVLGVCFGHQVIARALGAEVGRSAGGWEISVCGLEVTAEGERVFGEGGLALYQMHRDAVAAHPAGTIALSSSARCAVQDLYIPERLLTVEAHPEFSADVMEEILSVRYGLGVFDREQFEEAMGRCGGQVHGERVGAAMVRLVRGEL